MNDIFSTNSQLETPTIDDGEIPRQRRIYLAEKIKNEIDDWSRVTYADDYRWHLGASIIGRPCDRFLYGTFRWWKKNTASGRMLRLFQRGKDEEAQMNYLLRGIGFNVNEIDPSTGKQWRVSFLNGHFGGSSDGVVQFPQSWNVPGEFIPEYKTSGTGAKFNNLGKDGLGIEQNKEEHFIQQSIYGYGRKIAHGVYIAVNKNDDDLYVEVTNLSIPKAEAGIRRAENIITTDFVPAMMPKAKPTWHECKTCPFHGICHEGDKIDKNCRSCVHSAPVNNAEWRCTKYGHDIPREFVPIGCDEYKAVI